MSTPILRASCVLIAALGLAVAGCGSESDPADGAATAKKQSARIKDVPKPGEHSTADMVAAVSAGKGGAPVELKFELRQRPEVGQPVEMQLALIPISPNIERLHAVFQPSDGLELVAGGEIPELDKPAQGVVIRDSLKVLPKRDGIFTVTAVVSVDSTNESLVRTFSIPLIAGQGLPELAAKSEVAEGHVANRTKVQ